VIHGAESEVKRLRKKKEDFIQDLLDKYPEESAYCIDVFRRHSEGENKDAEICQKMYERVREYAVFVLGEDKCKQLEEATKQKDGAIDYSEAIYLLKNSADANKEMPGIRQSKGVQEIDRQISEATAYLDQLIAESKQAPAVIRKEFGLLAQDVKELSGDTEYARLVSEDVNGRYGLDQSSLVAVLGAALQNALARIAELESKLGAQDKTADSETKSDSRDKTTGSGSKSRTKPKK
jgi:hypothetical protein